MLFIEPHSPAHNTATWQASLAPVMAGTEGSQRGVSTLHRHLPQLPLSSSLGPQGRGIWSLLPQRAGALRAATLDLPWLQHLACCSVHRSRPPGSTSYLDYHRTLLPTEVPTPGCLGLLGTKALGTEHVRGGAASGCGDGRASPKGPGGHLSRHGSCRGCRRDPAGRYRLWGRSQPSSREAPEHSQPQHSA